MSAESELALQRKNTAAFIDAKPTLISLTTEVETTTPSGGKFRVNGPARGPQNFRVILMRFDQRPTVTAAGVERLIDYTLMGTWDSEMEVGDRWQDFEGTWYEIVAITEGHGYEKKALCSRHVPK